MRLVVDASIAVKWSVIEQDSDLAAKLIESDHELIAPELLAVEVANALTSLGAGERSTASTRTTRLLDYRYHRDLCARRITCC